MGPSNPRQGDCLRSGFKLLGKRSHCSRLVICLTPEQSVLAGGGVGESQGHIAQSWLQGFQLCVWNCSQRRELLWKAGSHPSQSQHAYLFLADLPPSCIHLFFPVVFSAVTSPPIEILLNCQGSAENSPSPGIFSDPFR